MNSELLFNDGVLQNSRVLNGLLKSDVEQNESQSSLKKKAAKYYKQALELFEQEEYEKALDTINKALKLNPKNSVYKQLMQKIEDAKDELELQDEADELAARANEYLDNERFDDALRTIGKALKMFPDNRKYKRIKQKIEDAKEEYEIYQRQEEAKKLIDKAENLLKQSRFDEALKKVEEAKEIDPDNAFLYNSKRRDIENARIDYNEQKQLEEAKDLAFQAKYLLKQNRFIEALKAIEDALSIEPDNSEYRQLKRDIELEKDPFSTKNKEAGDRAVKEINGVEFAFRWCPPGTFMMGTEGEEGLTVNEAQHQVTLTKGFWIMETEVTQKQWKAVMGNNPSHFKGDDLPVESVSWFDCQAFCKKCAQLGFSVDFPTTAQWEYACRAGTTDDYAGNVEDMAWHLDNSDGKTHPVARKKPNAWGLYDMHGNVNEWNRNWVETYWIDSVTDPVGPLLGNLRVICSGDWNNRSWFCRSASHAGAEPDSKQSIIGVRFVKAQ